MVTDSLHHNISHNLEKYLQCGKFFLECWFHCLFKWKYFDISSCQELSISWIHSSSHRSGLSHCRFKTLVNCFLTNSKKGHDFVEDCLVSLFVLGLFFALLKGSILLSSTTIQLYNFYKFSSLFSLKMYKFSKQTTHKIKMFNLKWKIVKDCKMVLLVTSNFHVWAPGEGWYVGCLVLRSATVQRWLEDGGRVREGEGGWTDATKTRSSSSSEPCVLSHVPL